jgi:hypothetical protein
VRLAIGVVLAAVVSQMQAGQLVTGGLTDVLDKAHASYPNPVGIFPRHGWFGGFRRPDDRAGRGRQAAFAGRLKDTVNADSVRDDLAGVVHQAMEPTLVSVWVNDHWT